MIKLAKQLATELTLLVNHQRLLYHDDVGQQMGVTMMCTSSQQEARLGTSIYTTRTNASSHCMNQRDKPINKDADS